MPGPLELLVIDPQNDFCDLPEAYRPGAPSGAVAASQAPALPVTGAHADMLRVASLIDRGRDVLSGITITLDSHQRIDVAHPTFWQTGDGAPVQPFTTITAASVRSGEFRPRDKSAHDRTLAYLDALETRGRYNLMVWPVHCEIGSWGHNVHADVRAAYNLWEEQKLTQVRKISKGENPWTEHYSALLAEVPLQDDPHTLLNQDLITALDRAGTLLIGGEAGSHCVRATTEHLVAHLPEQTPARMSRVVLLTDCMSPVMGFEQQQQDFFEAMRARGVTLMTSDDAGARFF